jgi:hypothetical protein
MQRCKELRVCGKWPSSYVAHRQSLTCRRKERGREARQVFLQNQKEVREALIQCGWGPDKEARKANARSE